jgi:hypothetical protein
MIVHRLAGVTDQSFITLYRDPENPASRCETGTPSGAYFGRRGAWSGSNLYRALKKYW